MSREDKLVNKILEHYRSDEWSNVVKAEPEAHYDHYGQRGVADLYIRTEYADGSGGYSDYVIEVKSAPAVENATGANEIIRQFNKMRQYFYKDESRDVPGEIHFHLLFTVSETTVRHVAENISQYTSSAESDPSELYRTELHSDIFFRAHDTPFAAPVHICGPETERHPSTEDWYKFVAQRDGPNYEQVADILKTVV